RTEAWQYGTEIEASAPGAAGFAPDLGLPLIDLLAHGLADQILQRIQGERCRGRPGGGCLGGRADPIRQMPLGVAHGVRASHLQEVGRGYAQDLGESEEVPDPQVELAVEHAVEAAVADAEMALHLADGHAARVDGLAEHLAELPEILVGHG